MVVYFPKLLKDTNSQGEEAQEIPSSVNKKNESWIWNRIFQEQGWQKDASRQNKKSFKKDLKMVPKWLFIWKNMNWNP